MPLFSYTARDRSGNLTTGTVEASTNSQAAAFLREQGLWVTDLQVKAGAAVQGRVRLDHVPDQEKNLAYQLRSPVSLKDLSLFYRQLHTLLNSGMALYQSLETLTQPTQTPNAQLRRVVGELARQVLAGGRLSETMARFPWLFDRMQVRMVEAGEAGGLLVEIFRRLAEYLEREFETRLKIKQKTLYPKLLLLALIFIPPIPALVLSGPVAYFWALWGTFQIILCLIPVWLALRYFVSTRAGRDFYDQVKLALPVIGPLVRKLAVSRFARTLAALYGAGVPIASALSMASESSGNSVLEAKGLQMAPALERGISITQAVGGTGFFPPMFVGMVGTGETTGNLDQMLEKAADFYEEEAMHAIVQLVVILGVVLLLLMGILIAIRVISFYTGYFGSLGAEGAEGAGGAPGAPGGLAGDE